jgi:NDP-sugar pyrophosphorylase family protein
VIRFVSKHEDHTGAGNLTNAGLCIVEPQVVRYMEAVEFTLETYLYPRLLQAGARFQGYVTDDYIRDIGTPERLAKAMRELET